MSSAGQAVGGIVGAVAGFFVGGPGGAWQGAMYGASIGMAVGGALDPPKGPNIIGPRLDDLTVQTSTYGAVIPRIYGTLAVTGNVFWLENNKIKERKKKKSSGGKGGGSQTTTTTFSYSATFAVGLCDCPTEPIVGVRRIWIAGRLWYDAGSSDQGTIIASNAAAQYFTVHTGSDTQMPDDRMQATLGVANTPAYRGLAYIVFKDLPLAEYSNSLMGAQIKVEVIGKGSTDTIVQVFSTTTLSAVPWTDIVWNGSVFCMVGENGGCATSKDGLIWTQGLIGGLTTWNWDGVIWNGKKFVAWNDRTYPNCRTAISTDGLNWTISSALPNPPWGIQVIGWNDPYFFALYGSSCAISPDGLSWSIASTLPILGNWLCLATNGSIWVSLYLNKLITSPDGINWTGTVSVPGLDSVIWRDVIWNGSIFLAVDGFTTSAATSPDGVNWTSHPMPSGSVGKGVCWTGKSFFNGGTNSLIHTSSDGITWTSKASITNANCWGAAWNGAVIACAYSNYSKAVVVYPDIVTSISPTLASIIESEVGQSSILTASDINTSDLTQTVRGYRIASVASLRSGIDPLQGAWPFDVIQSGYVVKFKKRGSASVATIPAADLDARAAGQDPGVSITNVREMDSVLPRCVRISFMDYDREYETNEQRDERLNTDAVNVSSVELSVVLTCGEAAGIAQVLLYLYWMERYDVRFSLPPTYAMLEPGDVVTIQASEGTYSLRLTAITYTQDGRLECSAKYASAAIYTPTAVGVSGSATPQTLTRVGPSVLALLDIPLLMDSSDRPGYVAAMTGALAGWQGGVFYRSDDAGQTWSIVQGVLAPGAEIGLATNVIGSGRTDIIDSTSALTVSLIQGALSSVTESAMLNGANYFAYGVDGRWEIIAAQTCTLQGDGSYVLTNLLRGRKGSEWACGLHAAGDLIIAMDSASVDFISVSLDSIGAARTYRGVTSGQELEAASDLAFTYAGVNLECLSPVYLNGNRHPATADWSLDWIRRTRIGGEWRDNVDATLGEASEAYEVDIFATSAYATVKRTLTGLSSATAIYTSAQQIADFGGNQTTLYLKIYQMSATVGRGYPLTTSITR